MLERGCATLAQFTGVGEAEGFKILVENQILIEVEEEFFVPPQDRLMKQEEKELAGTG